MPPTRKLGSRLALWRTQAINDVVVVLPCVPAITTGDRSRKNKSFTTAGIDV